MKYAELSIGNLVYYNGNVIKVESITKRKVGYHLKPNESRMHYARMSEIFPIPITEEILKKFGFKEMFGRGCDSYEKYLSNYHRIEVVMDENIIDAHIRYGGWKCHLRTIKYLHELQNIVRAITSKELEIQL